MRREQLEIEIIGKTAKSAIGNAINPDGFSFERVAGFASRFHFSVDERKHLFGLGAVLVVNRIHDPVGLVMGQNGTRRKYFTGDHPLDQEASRWYYYGQLRDNKQREHIRKFVCKRHEENGFQFGKFFFDFCFACDFVLTLAAESITVVRVHSSSCMKMTSFTSLK